MSSFFSTGVGKTCLLLRYANDSFSPTFITTIGIDFKIKNIQLDGKRIKLQVNTIMHFGCNRFSVDFYLDLGYSWSRTLQNDHYIILPWSSRNPAGI